MKRILCWDEKFIETNNGIIVLQHKPEKKNVALRCDDCWEGASNGYAGIMKVGDKYRMYYRAAAKECDIDPKYQATAKESICVAESTDGIHFKKPNVGKYEYNGTKNNNIVYIEDRYPFIDNFSVFYDENPDCPPDEKFKALKLVFGFHFENEFPNTTFEHSKLEYFASADGYDFRLIGFLPIYSAFDSYNVLFWDKEEKQYRLYYRHYHHSDGSEFTDDDPVDGFNDIRDVRLATSKDFKNWVRHGRIRFDEGQRDCALYTNQITRYYREPNTFIGFPVRYVDRVGDPKSFEYMPLGDRHKAVTEKFNREGTALTDCMIMTSQDGFTFNRRDEAFLTPGIETRYNWWYGDCYTVYGLVETEAEDGAPNEISFYMGENNRIKHVDFRRYTVRLDGFFSWYAPFAGGEVITKAFPVEGDKIVANFASSGAGGMTICILDETNSPIEGYESYDLFGDTVNRPVEFKKPLSDLKGKNIKLKIRLKDCHLYSLTIE